MPALVEFRDDHAVIRQSLARPAQFHEALQPASYAGPEDNMIDEIGITGLHRADLPPAARLRSAPLGSLSSQSAQTRSPDWASRRLKSPITTNAAPSPALASIQASTTGT